MGYFIAGVHRLMVTDVLRDDLHEVFKGMPVSLVYSDPPWNRGNLSSWYHKAKVGVVPDFNALTDRLIRLSMQYSPRVAYMEMGREYVDLVVAQMEAQSVNVTNVWKVSYYRKRPSRLIRFSLQDPTPLDFDFNGWDDMQTVLKAIELEANPSGAVVDFCSGKGRTAKCAMRHGLSFIGTELNAKRADLLLDWWRAKGLEVSRVGD